MLEIRSRGFDRAKIPEGVRFAAAGRRKIGIH